MVQNDGDGLMRYLIVDSHKNMTKKRKDALANFFMTAKNIPVGTAYEQVDFCDWYESEYAVKWFEIIVLNGEMVTGYLRCLRNPDDVKEWYIGDVYVNCEFRRKRIALKMYEKVFKELMRYEAAERVIATVNRNNTASIGLHLKTGFQDTGKAVEFASFYAAPEETVYTKRILRMLPFPDEMSDDDIMSFILPLWMEYFGKSGKSIKKASISKLAKEKLMEALRKRKTDGTEFSCIWCGNRLAGFRYNGTEFISRFI